MQIAQLSYKENYSLAILCLSQLLKVAESQNNMSLKFSFGCDM